MQPPETGLAQNWKKFPVVRGFHFSEGFIIHDINFLGPTTAN